MKHFTVFLFAALLAGCASTPQSTGPERKPTPTEKRVTANLGPDLSKLKRVLGIDRALNNLGYAEKAFDSCRHEYAESGGKCGRRVLTVVNFRLLCRDTEDTTQTVVTEMTPIHSANVKWKVADATGITQTDSEGYGTVQVVSNQTLQRQRLVLTVGRQFLGLQMSEVSRIVVPVYWCTERALMGFPMESRHASCQKPQADQVNLSVE